MSLLQPMEVVTIHPGVVIASALTGFAAMWGVLVWFIKQGAERENRIEKAAIEREQAIRKSSGEREAFIIQTGSVREQKMAEVVGRMEDWQKTTMAAIIEGNRIALNQHTTALERNTRATEELQREIGDLRKEQRARRSRGEDSSIG
jgi:hypothetical protein